MTQPFAGDGHDTLAYQVPACGQGRNDNNQCRHRPGADRFVGRHRNQHDKQEEQGEVAAVGEKGMRNRGRCMIPALASL